MPDHDIFWDVYWETRLLPMENLGKRAAILAASRLIRELAPQAGRPLRILELGSGEGQVIGALLDAHFQECSREFSAGVDYSASSIARCRQDYPGLTCVHGDFVDSELLAGLCAGLGTGSDPLPGAFDLILLVNALHEVFSDCLIPGRTEIDVPAAKQQVAHALQGAVSCLEPGGWLVLFDGLEPSGDLNQLLRIRFRDDHIRHEFETFAEEYRPVQIKYRHLETLLCVELTRQDFTRYLTKSIFLGKALWESERLQSYQYYTEEEFRSAFARVGLEIVELRTLTMNEEKWRYRVEIETPGARFPDEHVLILARLSRQR
jgi:SAM-dependent methyltransferase